MHCPASDYSRLSRKPLTALDYSRAMCLLSAPPLRIPAIFLLLRKGPIMAIQPPPSASKSPRTDAYHRPRPHHRQQGTADASPSDPMGQIPAETPPPPLDHGRYKNRNHLGAPRRKLGCHEWGRQGRTSSKVMSRNAPRVLRKSIFPCDSGGESVDSLIPLLWFPAAFVPSLFPHGVAAQMWASWRREAAPLAKSSWSMRASFPRAMDRGSCVVGQGAPAHSTAEGAGIAETYHSRAAASGK